MKANWVWYIGMGARECILSKLDLFKVPPTQAFIDHSLFVNFFAIRSLNSGPIEFHVPTFENEYLDVITFIGTQRTGSSTAKDPKIQRRGLEHLTLVYSINLDDVVFPVNSFRSFYFKSLEVQVNNPTVNKISIHYAYRSYLETLLSFNCGVKKSALNIILWAKDAYPDDNFDDFDKNYGIKFA